MLATTLALTGPGNTVARPRPRRSRDPGGAARLAVGLDAIALGAGLTIASQASSYASDDARDFDDRDRSRTLLVGGAVSFAVGGGLLADAMIRCAPAARRVCPSARLHADGARLGLVGRC